MTYHNPISGPACGGTPIKINGFGFKPFEDRIDPKSGLPSNKMWIRYIDTATGLVIAGPKTIDSDNYSNERIDTLSEPEPMGTKALI